jgi:hypothetical protein
VVICFCGDVENVWVSLRLRLIAIDVAAPQKRKRRPEGRRISGTSSAKTAKSIPRNNDQATCFFALIRTN